MNSQHADQHAEKQGESSSSDPEPLVQKPEGRPAFRGTTPGQIILLIVLALSSVIVAAVIIGLTLSPAIGFGLGAFGVILAICSPVFWASSQRAADRL